MAIAKLHVKKGDTVLVLSGKDKGKQGKVLQALPKKNKVVVEGMNKVKRHTRPNQNVPQGGICLLYTSPSPRDEAKSRMPSSA